jgi:hypothetical protein
MRCKSLWHPDCRDLPVFLLKSQSVDKSTHSETLRWIPLDFGVR